MARAIQLTVTARHRLEEIILFYTAGGHPKKGKRLVRHILKQISAVGKHPKIGAIEESVSSAERKYRFLVTNRDYKVFYVIESESIIVVEIFDVRQDPSRLQIT